MAAATKVGILAASRIRLVLEQWLEPKHEEFRPRVAWSLFNAFTEVAKNSPPGRRWRVRSALVRSFAASFRSHDSHKGAIQ
jgi:hypothetical protein